MPRLSAYQVLFPAAALWALAMVGLKVASASGWLVVPDYWPLAWHGHELIFGYAYAVVGGYLLTRPGPAGGALVLGAWILGRVATLGPAMPPVVTGAMALAFPVALFLGAGLPLARAAKKPRNWVFAPLLAGLILAEGLYQLGVRGMVPAGPASGLLLGADLLGLLLFVMGGRFLASVASGRHQARGRWLVRLSQPRRERVGVMILPAMALLDVLAVVAGLPVTLPGFLAILGSVLIAVRLGGWRGWRLLDDPETAVLQAGYLWLGAGLALKGAVQMAGVVFPVGALHVLLVGGLGTLTLAVMTRVLRSRRGLAPPLPPVAAMAAALVSVAAMARIAAWVGPEAPLWLGVAGLAWCLAWTLFLAGPVRNHFRDSVS